MARIVWSKNAINDLKSLANYIANDSPYYSKIIVKKIYKTISRLEQFPKSGRVIPEFNDENFREVIVSPYRIFYLFDSFDIKIITIVHSKQEVF